MKKVTLHIQNENEMLALAAELAAHAPVGIIIYLIGQLGAGKTTFTRGFLRGLGVTEKVKSPSYTLVEPYVINNIDIYHFDFYRIEHANELEHIGIKEYFTNHAICLIEWPEKGLALLPPADLSCYIAFDNNARIITFEAQTKRGEITIASIQGE